MNLNQNVLFLYLTRERPRGGGGSNGPAIGFLDLKFEALKQSKWNFKHL